MSIRNLTLSVRASVMFILPSVMFILLPVMFILLMSASAAFAQQSTDQQKCLNKLNKDGTLVAKEQGKQNFGCLKGAGAGTLTGTAQACLTADPKGKLLAKKNNVQKNVIFYDQFAKKNVKSTSDTQLVAKPSAGMSFSTLTVIYAP